MTNLATLPPEVYKQEQMVVAKRLSHLRLASIVAADPASQFKLITEIAEAEQRLRELAELLCQASAASASDQLYQALLDLDYKQQIWRFRQFMACQPVFACLIHGEPYHGQRWLLNQLINMVPGSIAAQKVLVNLGRRGRSTSITALWRELGQQVGLTGSPTVETIAQKIYQWLQTQSVVIILDQVDILPIEQIVMLQTQFWNPMVTKVAEGDIPLQHRLLLILIDYSGGTEQWPWASARQPGPDWQPQLMVRLPQITRFTLELLVNWIVNQVRVLPMTALDTPDATAHELLTASEEGVPEYVLEAICTLCQLRWNDYESIWMKY